MAVNGSFETNKYGGVRGLKFSWSLISQSIDGNYSDISWSFVGSGSGSTWYYTLNGYLNINGSNVWTQGSSKIQLSSGTVVASGTARIYHNSDGSKSFSADGGATIYNYGTYQTGSGSWSLPTIARASQPSCITYPNTTTNIGNLGNTITIHMNRKSTSFTHTVKYAWGNKSGTIATGVGDNCQWTIPKNFADNIPNATSGTGTITVDTYNGGTYIGSKSVSFTANVPATDEFKPSISSVALSEAGNVPSSLGFYVQNNSKIKGVVSAKGAYSSTINSYSISINNESFISSTFTTSIITLVNPKLKVTVKDTRGRSKSYEQTVPVLEYRVPTITSFSAFRNANNPNKIDVSFSCIIYKLNNKNTKNFRFYYKKGSDPNYSNIPITNLKEVASGNTITYSANYSIIDSEADSSYDTYITATDIFNVPVNSAFSFVNTAFRLLNISANKRNFAVGKLHEKAGYNEKAIPEIYYDNIYRQDGDYNGIVMSCPSIKNGEVRFNNTNKTLEIEINGVTYQLQLGVKA